MMGDRFATNGSPLAGRLVPRDWKMMNLAARRACLIANGWATDVYDAGRVLAKHAAAAVQGRKIKQARAALAMSRWEN